MFSVNQTLRVKLDDYVFYIGQGATDEKRYTYSDRMSDSDMREIVNDLLKKQLSEITGKRNGGATRK